MKIPSIKIVEILLVVMCTVLWQNQIAAAESKPLLMSQADRGSGTKQKSTQIGNLGQSLTGYWQSDWVPSAPGSVQDFASAIAFAENNSVPLKGFWLRDPDGSGSLMNTAECSDGKMRYLLQKVDGNASLCFYDKTKRDAKTSPCSVIRYSIKLLVKDEMHLEQIIPQNPNHTTQVFRRLSRDPGYRPSKLTQ